MINPINSASNVKKLTQASFKSLLFKMPSIGDSFDKTSKYINNISIYKKLCGIRYGKQEVQVFAENIKPGYKKYSISNGKNVLGDIDIRITNDEIFIINLESYARKKYKGIGTKLIQIACEESLKKSGAKNITLNAQKLRFLQRSPIKFYEKIGFETVPNQSYNDISTYGTAMVYNVSQNSRMMNKIKSSPILPSN